MHYWNKHVWDLTKFLSWVCQLIKEVNQCLEIFIVLVGLCSGCLNFFLELTEGSSIG